MKAKIVDRLNSKACSKMKDLALVELLSAGSIPAGYR